jgi:hypothetical protein
VFAAVSTTSLVAFLGLSSTLASAVNDILRLSEEEPYGIRGASIILKFRLDPFLKSFLNSFVKRFTYECSRLVGSSYF